MAIPSDIAHWTQADAALKPGLQFRVLLDPHDELDPAGDGGMPPGRQPAGPLARNAVEYRHLFQGADECLARDRPATIDVRLAFAIPRQEAEDDEQIECDAGNRRKRGVSLVIFRPVAEKWLARLPQQIDGKQATHQKYACKKTGDDA